MYWWGRLLSMRWTEQLEESGDPWSRDQNVEDEVGFVRECDAVRAISLSAHSEDVDERGMIKVTKWDREDKIASVWRNESSNGAHTLWITN